MIKAKKPIKLGNIVGELSRRSKLNHASPSTIKAGDIVQRGKGCIQNSGRTWNPRRRRGRDARHGGQLTLGCCRGCRYTRIGEATAQSERGNIGDRLVIHDVSGIHERRCNLLRCSNERSWCRPHRALHYCTCHNLLWHSQSPYSIKSRA